MATKKTTAAKKAETIEVLVTGNYRTANIAFNTDADGDFDIVCDESGFSGWISATEAAELYEILKTHFGDRAPNA